MKEEYKIKLLALVKLIKKRLCKLVGCNFSLVDEVTVNAISKHQSYTKFTLSCKRCKGDMMIGMLVPITEIELEDAILLEKFKKGLIVK